MHLYNQIDSNQRYTMIPRTLIFLTNNEDEVLLIKGSPTKRLWANLYNGIGGHIERGEDVLTSANREYFEETGLVLEELRVCAIVTIDVKEKYGVLLFVMRAENYHGTLVSSNEGDLEWVKVEQIHSLPVVEDIHQLLPRILKIKKTDPILSMNYSYDNNGKLNINIEE